MGPSRGAADLLRTGDAVGGAVAKQRRAAVGRSAEDCFGWTEREHDVGNVR